MALGLKVVRPNGGPVNLGRAVGRYFAKWLSSITLGIGYIIAGFDAEKRAMHDMIVRHPRDQSGRRRRRPVRARQV